MSVWNRALGGLCLLLILTTPVAAAPVRVGDAAPDFSLADVQGTTHTLSDFRGQVVLLGLIGYS